MADQNKAIPDADADAPKLSDNPIDRMIDIAIEAQDGKPVENKDTDTPSGEEKDKKPAEVQVDNKDSTGGASDGVAQPKPDEKGKEASQQAHGPKDLVLKGQGPDGADLVIKGGPERRFYEQRETARQQARHFETQATTAQQRAQQLEQELNTLKTTTQSLHGVDPNTLKIGAQIVTDLQRDPVGTMKKLLAEVVAQGYTVDQIGSGVDTLALQRLIDERLPQRDTQPTEQDILVEAQREIDQFYNRHADARPHDALLGRMLRDHPTLDLESAYYQLKDAFAEKGFDWSLPLEKNLEQSSPNNAPQSNNQQQQQQQPLPNGRTGDVGLKPADEVKIAHEDTDNGEIVKQAMREAGMNV